jgi:hypothetical protein
VKPACGTRADYIADHYGDCKLTHHECHVVNKCPGTQACPNWIPTPAKSFDELMELARAQYRKPMETT